MQYSTRHLAAVAEKIRGRFPELVSNPEMAKSLESNVASMIGEAHARYAAGSTTSIVSDAFLDPAHLATGALHAKETQHPAGAMLAAEMLFDAYLPFFVQEVAAVEPSEILAAARALHAGIWTRFPAGAIAYTEALRQRASTAHLDSRTQIARDLHDRIAHSILAGVQRVDLVLYTDPPADPSAGHLRDAARLLRDSLRQVQELAVALHARVGDDHLDSALARHVADLFPAAVVVSIESRGNPAQMPNWKSEEALAILLEALTNWRKHAASSTASVAFSWSETSVIVTVSDDGPGFDERRETPGRLGQQTMRERAALIGAQLTVRSEPDVGTVVTLSIPLSTS